MISRFEDAGKLNMDWAHLSQYFLKINWGKTYKELK